MLNKAILLASLGVKTQGELICRVKVTVGESTQNGLTMRGFESGVVNNAFGACETIDGDIALLALFDVPSNVGGNNATHMGVMPIFVSSVQMLNETTGASFVASNLLQGDEWCMFAPTSEDLLFSGVAAGQECIIAIYK